MIPTATRVTIAVRFADVEHRADLLPINGICNPYTNRCSRDIMDVPWQPTSSSSTAPGSTT